MAWVRTMIEMFDNNLRFVTRLTSDGYCDDTYTPYSESNPAKEYFFSPSEIERQLLTHSLGEIHFFVASARKHPVRNLICFHR